jgi:LacI family transcriptional regulator
VFFDRIPKRNDIHYVVCNLENGMADAVQFLVKRGHRNIALINGPKTVVASNERLEGYMNALARRKIKIDPQYILSTDLTSEGTFQAMKELLQMKRRPTAIISFNDYTALDAMKFAKRNGIRINEDISFVSFANLPVCHYMENPPLASLEQFPYEQGNKAAEILWMLLDQPEKAFNGPFEKIVLESKLMAHENETDLQLEKQE